MENHFDLFSKGKEGKHGKLLSYQWISGAQFSGTFPNQKGKVGKLPSYQWISGIDGFASFLETLRTVAPQDVSHVFLVSLFSKGNSKPRLPGDFPLFSLFPSGIQKTSRVEVQA